MTKNILMVSNYDSSTGYAWWLMEHFWILFSEACKDSQAFLAYPRITSLPKSIAESKIRPIELDYNKKGINATYELIAFILKNKIQVLYLTDQPFFSTFYLLLRFAGIKRIIVHDHTPGDRPPVEGVKGLLKSIRNYLWFFTADLVMNVSPLMKSRSENNGRIPKQKCVSVQNGIHLEGNNRLENTRINIRDELGINPDAILVVSSSRLHPYKRVDFGIKVFEKATINNSDNVHYIVLGDGPDKKKLMDLTSTMKCESRIHFLGFRDDVSQILTQSDIAVHCSKGEGFSLSIIEFLASGLPVLVPNIPSVCQAIIENKTGLIFQDNNIEDAAKKLTVLINDTESRKEMRYNAKQTSRDRYSLETTDREFLTALQYVGLI